MNLTKNAVAIAVFIATMEEPCYAMPPPAGIRGAGRPKPREGNIEDRRRDTRKKLQDKIAARKEKKEQEEKAPPGK